MLYRAGAENEAVRELRRLPLCCSRSGSRKGARCGCWGKRMSGWLGYGLAAIGGVWFAIALIKLDIWWRDGE